jgi:hypothetical protein
MSVHRVRLAVLTVLAVASCGVLANSAAAPLAWRDLDLGTRTFAMHARACVVGVWQLQEGEKHLPGNRTLLIRKASRTSYSCYRAIETERGIRGAGLTIGLVYTAQGLKLLDDASGLEFGSYLSSLGERPEVDQGWGKRHLRTAHLKWREGLSRLHRGLLLVDSARRTVAMAPLTALVFRG